ncbi:hypothetical protein KGY64_07590 [Candidatus Bipolaricaulota bacterium]|nr:hypothetical protein [Candidatus Bipolaricaulota bacterium]
MEKVSPVTGVIGEVKVEVDGKSTPKEDWADALTYEVPDSDIFEEFSLGYGPNDLFVRLTTAEPAQYLIGEDLSICLYVSGQNRANSLTRYGEEEIGFGPSQLVALHLEDVDQEGNWNVFRYESDGWGGWNFASDIGNLSRRKASVDDFIEFKFPLETIDIDREENFIFRLSIEQRTGKGQLNVVPDKPVRTKVPRPISGERIISLSDPANDDYGPGGFTYPRDSVFDYDGLFDLRRYQIFNEEDKWVFAFDFGQMTNPWSAPLGFSHQLINLYLDVRDGGRTKTYRKGANVKFPQDSGWDYFLKVAGWPGYGRELITANGDEYKVDVSSDLKRNRVIVGVPKELLPTIGGGHYLTIFSQDGYGKDHIRDVRKESSTWQGGGSPNPSIAPNVYDYLDPEGGQKDILSNYKLEEEEFAALRPYEITGS